MKVKVDTEPLEQALDGLAADLEQGFTKSMPRVAEHMSRSTELTFRQAGRPVPWEPTSPYTLARRQVNRQPNPLVDTRELIESVTATRPGKKSSLFEMNGHRLVMGTTREGAALNQETRPFLLFQEQGREEIPGLLLPELREKVRRHAG
jgi:phage gpG-like protein